MSLYRKTKQNKKHCLDKIVSIDARKEMSKFVDIVPRVLKGFKLMKIPYVYPLCMLNYNFTGQEVNQIYSN